MATRFKVNDRAGALKMQDWNMEDQAWREVRAFKKGQPSVILLILAPFINLYIFVIYSGIGHPSEH